MRSLMLDFSSTIEYPVDLYVCTPLQRIGVADSYACCRSFNPLSSMMNDAITVAITAPGRLNIRLAYVRR